MINFWNNVNPSHVSFGPGTEKPITVPPLNAPLPNHLLPPGFTPTLPAPAIPAPSGNLKNFLNSLPSIFNLNHGNKQ